jgi:hypothetical protein
VPEHLELGVREVVLEEGTHMGGIVSQDVVQVGDSMTQSCGVKLWQGK